MKKGFKNKMKSEHQPDIKSSKHIAAGTRKLAHKFLEVPFLRATHLPIGQHLLQNFKLSVFLITSHQNLGIDNMLTQCNLELIRNCSLMVYLRYESVWIQEILLHTLWEDEPGIKILCNPKENIQNEGRCLRRNMVENDKMEPRAPNCAVESAEDLCQRMWRKVLGEKWRAHWEGMLLSCLKQMKILELQKLFIQRANDVNPSIQVELQWLG